MSSNDEAGLPQIRFGPIRWLSDHIRLRIEEIVSEHKGCVWRIDSEKDLSEFACHHCAIVSNGSVKIFFKYSEDANADNQFEIELAGLRTLKAKAGIPIPQPIKIANTESGTLLLMDALQPIERGPRQWRQIGATLAHIHRVKSAFCGFETNGFCGPLFHDNTKENDWMTFYGERRLLPRLRVAIDSGNIPSSVILKVEKLIARLPGIGCQEITPSLLHGDAQQNNFICTKDGAYAIDPAIYYGNPEIDLALVDSFQPVPDTLFEGYKEIAPIDKGFFERRDLWRIPLYLAAVALEGKIHLNRLINALKTYE